MSDSQVTGENDADLHLALLPPPVQKVVVAIARAFRREGTWPLQHEVHLIGVDLGAEDEILRPYHSALFTDVHRDNCVYSGLRNWALWDSSFFEGVFRFAHQLIHEAFRVVRATRKPVQWSRSEIAKRWGQREDEVQLKHLAHIFRECNRSSLQETPDKDEWSLLVSTHGVTAKTVPLDELLIGRPRRSSIVGSKEFAAARWPSDGRDGRGATAAAANEMPAVVAYSRRVNIRLGSLPDDALCDLLVLPCNALGGVSAWVLDIVKNTGSVRAVPMAHGALGAAWRMGSSSYVYAASVDADDTARPDKIEAIGRALGELASSSLYDRVGVPLLGAGIDAHGNERLSPLQSFTSMARGFESSARGAARLIVLVPDIGRYERLRRDIGGDRPGGALGGVGVSGQSSDGGKIGSGVELRREAAPTELCLGVDRYAEALRRVLTQSGGDVSFAVFGAWGRGKTTLARRLCQSLESQAPSPRYRSVWFNAWKYRTPPEIWAHLYERMAEGARSDGWTATQARLFRANLARFGLNPLSAWLCLLAVGLLPLATKLEASFRMASALVTSLGVLASVWLMLGLNKTASVMRRVWEQYGGIPSHQDKLGLQAAIGRDLRCLLQGWIPRVFRQADGPPGKRKEHARVADEPVGNDRSPERAGLAFFAVGVLSVAAALLYGMYRSKAAAGWMCGVMPIMWLGICGVLAGTVTLAGRQIDRVLLVIDDLDRCPPDQLLEIVESIKLLVEEPECRERLQVVVLVDERVLAQAIEIRFQHLVDSGVASAGSSDRRRIVREHVEKLFLGHVCLGGLSSVDVESLVRGVTGGIGVGRMGAWGNSPGANGDGARRAGADVPFRPLSSTDSATSPAVGSGVSHLGHTAGSIEGKGERGAVPQLTGVEVGILAARCQQLLSLSDGGRVGPRMVRSFIFRYQLARELLHVLGQEASPEAIADRLLSHHRSDGGRGDGSDGGTGDPAINAVIDQMSVVEVVVRG